MRADCAVGEITITTTAFIDQNLSSIIKNLETLELLYQPDKYVRVYIDWVVKLEPAQMLRKVETEDKVVLFNEKLILTRRRHITGRNSYF